MKRSAALAALAREHHEALVMARRLQRGTADDTALREAFLRAWHELLVPHFAIEERRLLPALEAAGEAGLAARTLAEHARLRVLMADIDAGKPDAMASFGALLNAHIRFEERELFVRAEAIFDEASLARLMQER